ncbi:MAG: hypothetical protein ACK4K6_16695 [Pseudarthrobacter sp.]
MSRWLIALELILTLLYLAGWVLALMAAGALLLAAAWTLGSGIASAAAVSADSGNEVANMFRDELVAAAAADFRGWTMAAAAGGGALLLLGLVAGFATRKRARASR